MRACLHRSENVWVRLLILCSLNRQTLTSGSIAGSDACDPAVASVVFASGGLLLTGATDELGAEDIVPRYSGSINVDLENFNPRIGIWLWMKRCL